MNRIGCGESRIRDWDLWEAVLALLALVKSKWEVEVLFWWVPHDCKSAIDPRRWHSSDPSHPLGNRDAKLLAGEGLKIPPPKLFQDRRPRREEC